MKTEKRGDKYVVILSDGEIEYTASEFEEIQKNNDNALWYIDSWLKKYSDKNWSSIDYPKEADLNLSLDMYFELTEKMILNELDKETKLKGREIALKSAFKVLDLLSLGFEQDTINPLGSRYEIAKYALKHIKLIKGKIEVIEKWEPKASVKRNLTFPVISLFCKLVNDSNLLPKTQDEAVKDYCQKVCSTFDIPYSDKVRQGFNGRITAKNLKLLKELILPGLASDSGKIINEYLDKISDKNQSLYH